MFIAIVLGVWALMHGYVFWRLSTIPWIAMHIRPRWLIAAAVLLYVSYPLARRLNRLGLEIIGHPLEFFSSNWMGVLFLLMSIFIIVDAITLGGFILKRWVPLIRTSGAIIALSLSLIALIQGLRPPVVREFEIPLRDLPKEHDGLLLVAISDTHLGTMIRPGWMRRVVARIDAMKPDIVCVVGDLLDSHGENSPDLLPALKSLRAPLGVYAVTGNHEFYVGMDRSVRLMEEAGYRVLKDESVEVAPGLVIAGVHDLTARRQLRFQHGKTPIEDALSTPTLGTTILLNHSPWQAEKAALLGADLMISGHTHNGQVWPFNYLVRLSYPLIIGQYMIDGMHVIVGRGTGTWGPRMRLWRRSEILKIRLLAGEAQTLT